MSKNINARIALKRDTDVNWTNYNPVLLNGELILVDIAEDQLRAKIGDGIKTYTQLPFTDEVLGDGGVSDNDILAALIETDSLPAITTTAGAILTDSNGNIILRY